MNQAMLPRRRREPVERKRGVPPFRLGRFQCVVSTEDRHGHSAKQVGMGMRADAWHCVFPQSVARANIGIRCDPVLRPKLAVSGPLKAKGKLSFLRREC